MNSQQRRLYLTRVLKVMILLIVFAGFFVLLSDLFRSQVPRQSIVVSITQLRTEIIVRVEWQGLPVILAIRTPETVAKLRQRNVELRDPDSGNSRQPEFALNPWRSAREDVIVLVAMGTAIGCPVVPVMKGGALAGFRDQCQGWLYDAAGRVYRNQDALRNLRVPPYQFFNEDIVLGEHQ